MRAYFAFLAALLSLLSPFLTACGNGSAASPFVDSNDAGADAPPRRSDAGTNPPPPLGDAAATDSGPLVLGAPCLVDGDCDDDVACTVDQCDPEALRCRFTPDDTSCDDGVYCNGVEQCVAGLGCSPGEPVACSDGTSCTIDACDEATHACTHTPRDADGDGDPDGNCPGGHDCNDQDPNVSSLHAEICGNSIDDNCNGQVDESPCVSPQYDTCVDPLDVTASGEFTLSPVAAKLDYAASCVKTGSGWTDLVVAIQVPEGAPTDVDVVATTNGDVGLASATTCGDASSIDACDASTAGSGGVARIRLRALASGAYPVYVFTDSGSPITLAVDYVAPEPAPANETCGTAASLTDGAHVDVNLTGTKIDVVSDCKGSVGDLAYAFELAEPRDVHVFATPKDADGTPILSLFAGTCAPASELTCRVGTNTELFARALSAGHYFLVVGATGPTDLDVVFETAAPTVAPADENCSGSPSLVPFVTTDVSLSGHVDDIHDGCSVGTPDAAYALSLSRTSDVMLVLGVSSGDQGSVSLVGATCGASDLSCATGTDAPVRAEADGVPAGVYHAVVESELGQPVTITALVRAATAPVLVPFADACADAAEVPADGGFFQGNTANATDDFTASCDLGGSRGSPDQLLHLRLDSPRRVVVDARGSQYTTLLDVRTGTTCPGDEVTGGCSAGFTSDRSYVDLSLPAGDYWIQIDGYDDDSGPWDLEVFVGPP
jgi:hypothetical protein